MWKDLPLFPEQASSVAGGVDGLYFYLVAISTIMVIVIYSGVFYFAIKYRRRRKEQAGAHIHGSTILEVTWSVIPALFIMVMFAWGAAAYFKIFTPPKAAMDIYVTGKQWMWKIQHPEGNREINELHVPVGVPVRLTMATEDVIHSFYVPAFRIKRDVVPGRFSNMWFTATKPGKYHLFCAEYCGTQHSGMTGWVYVMAPEDYQRWLAGGSPGETMAQTGAKLFDRLGCASCHRADATGRGPSLENIFGKAQALAGGARAVADEAYLRESILNPQAKVVAGFTTVMPTFQGQISEENLLQLVAYIKSLTKAQAPAAQPATEKNQ